MLAFLNKMAIVQSIIQQLIKLGENETVDFKQTISSAQKIAKALVSFANTKGGKILVGVKDNGSIAGANVDEEMHTIEAAANVFCKPPVSVSFKEEIVNGKSILVATVEESVDKPHFVLGDDQKWWAYIRVKDQCLLASKVMLDVMRSNSRGDASVVNFGFPEKVILQYLEKNNRITMKEFCKLANISRWRANKVLVTLVRMKIIKILSHEKTDYYSL